MRHVLQRDARLARHVCGNHPVDVEGQRLPSAVALYHLDAVDGSVGKARHQMGALTDCCRRHPSSDQRVDQCGLTRGDASGDHYLQRRFQPRDHLSHAVCGGLAALGKQFRTGSQNRSMQQTRRRHAATSPVWQLASPDDRATAGLAARFGGRA